LTEKSDSSRICAESGKNNKNKTAERTDYGYRDEDFFFLSVLFISFTSYKASTHAIQSTTFFTAPPDLSGGEFLFPGGTVYLFAADTGVNPTRFG